MYVFFGLFSYFVKVKLCYTRHVCENSALCEIGHFELIQHLFHWSQSLISFNTNFNFANFEFVTLQIMSNFIFKFNLLDDDCGNFKWLCIISGDGQIGVLIISDN